MYQDKVEKPLLTYDSLDNLDQIFQVKVEIMVSTITYWENSNI